VRIIELRADNGGVKHAEVEILLWYSFSGLVGIGVLTLIQLQVHSLQAPSVYLTHEPNSLLGSINQRVCDASYASLSCATVWGTTQLTWPCAAVHGRSDKLGGMLACISVIAVQGCYY
jgi:hypothetical protein